MPFTSSEPLFDMEGKAVEGCPANEALHDECTSETSFCCRDDYLKIIPPANLQGCSNASLAKDVTTYLFGEELKKHFHDEVKSRCAGCQNKRSDQFGHDMCLWMDDDDCQVNGILQESLNKVNISYLNDLYFETANILQVHLPCSWFFHQMQCQKDLWEQLRYFGVVVSAIKNMNYGQIANLGKLIEAVNSARVKVDKLDKHFTCSSSKY